MQRGWWDKDKNWVDREEVEVRFMWKEEGRKEGRKKWREGAEEGSWWFQWETERERRKTGQRREFKNFAVDASGDAGLDWNDYFGLFYFLSKIILVAFIWAVFIPAVDEQKEKLKWK